MEIDMGILGLEFMSGVTRFPGLVCVDKACREVSLINHPVGAKKVTKSEEEKNSTIP